MQQIWEDNHLECIILQQSAVCLLKKLRKAAKVSQSQDQPNDSMPVDISENFKRKNAGKWSSENLKQQWQQLTS